MQSKLAINKNIKPIHSNTGKLIQYFTSTSTDKNIFYQGNYINYTKTQFEDLVVSPPHPDISNCNCHN